jgi:hypothetical protein
MFDLIRKSFLRDAWDRGLDEEIGKAGAFHLKSIQDLAVYAQLQQMEALAIAEIGGDSSRLVRPLAEANRCLNIEKFEGSDGGPAKEIHIPGVKNVFAFLGEFSPQIAPASFEVVFSISVIEHVPFESLMAFFEDGMRVLQSGGLWLHAVDLCLEDTPDPNQQARFDTYRAWMSDRRLAPVGAVYEGPLKFSCDWPAIRTMSCTRGEGSRLPLLICVSGHSQFP